MNNLSSLSYLRKLKTCRYSEWIDECERVNTVDDDGVPVEDDAA